MVNLSRFDISVRRVYSIHRHMYAHSLVKESIVRHSTDYCERFSYAYVASM